MKCDRNFKFNKEMIVRKIWLTEWLMNGFELQIKQSRVILCLEVRELYSLYIFIHISCFYEHGPIF